MTRSARILVIADEVTARTSVAESLRSEGFEVDTATDATAGLAKRDAFSPHVVVMDFELLGVFALELVHALRTTEDPPAIIVVTGPTGTPDAVRALRAGAADHLTKPVHPEEVLIVIDRVLARASLERELETALEQAAHPLPTLRPTVASGAPPIPGSRLEDLERYAILETLKLMNGSTSKAAEMLGISVRTIQYRLQEYNASRSQSVVVPTADAGASG